MTSAVGLVLAPGACALCSIAIFLRVACFLLTVIKRNQAGDNYCSAQSLSGLVDRALSPTSRPFEVLFTELLLIP